VRWRGGKWGGAGEEFFIKAIGEISTREATLTLMELAEMQDFAGASVVARCLSQRIPFDSKALAPELKVKRQRMLETAWDESYTPRVRAIARKLVDSFNPKAPLVTTIYELKGGGRISGLVPSEYRDADLGAQMLAPLGTREDYATMRAALDKAIAWTATPRGAEGVISHLPLPMSTFIRTLDLLHERGHVQNVGLGEWQSCNGNAEIYLAFHWLANTPPPPHTRPKRWLESAKANVTNNYPIQMAILESIPEGGEPMSPECRELLVALLNSRDPGVMMHACLVAGKSGDKTLLPELLAIIRAEDHETLFRYACIAAKQLGAKRSLAEAVVERLPNDKLTANALLVLIALVTDYSPPASRGSLTRQERIDLQTAWRQFIAKNGKEIDAGKKYKADDRNFPIVLLGNMRWSQNGQDWPKK